MEETDWKYKAMRYVNTARLVAPFVAAAVAKAWPTPLTKALLVVAVAQFLARCLILLRPENRQRLKEMVEEDERRMLWAPQEEVERRGLLGVALLLCLVFGLGLLLGTCGQ